MDTSISAPRPYFVLPACTTSTCASEALLSRTIFAVSERMASLVEGDGSILPNNRGVCDPLVRISWK